MATTFDEVLLDPEYSAIAEGGPEFATAIVRSGQGGVIAGRGEVREDYLSEYEILYAEMDDTKRTAIRKFGILRKGMARGFRFLAPDDHEMEDENVGWLNPATGEVEYLTFTPASNTLDTFYLIKNYSDPGNAYNRRIVKPSPFEDVVIDWYNSPGNPEDLIGSATIPAGTALGAFNVIDPEVPFVIFTPGGVNFTFNFVEGKITADDGPLTDNTILRVTCTYHLPAAFKEDWLKFRVDESTISEFRIGVQEILPVELGIT